MADSKRCINDDHQIQVTHPRKKIKLSPNRNHHKTKHSKWYQNKANNHNNKNNNHVNYKYQQDLYETNKYLKRKIKSLQQSHSQQILQLKQKNSSKIHKLESKAIKLSTNLKKLGKMYQKLQTEYDKLLEQHQNLLYFVENNNENTNNDTMYDETQYSLNEINESQINNDKMTTIEYEEKKLNTNDNNYNNNTNESQILSNKICENNVNNNINTLVINSEQTNVIKYILNDNKMKQLLDKNNLRVMTNMFDYHPNTGDTGSVRNIYGIKEKNNMISMLVSLYMNGLCCKYNLINWTSNWHRLIAE
eukprot:360299_1